MNEKPLAVPPETQPSPPPKPQVCRTILYHLQTLWLFTRSDLKTIVYPETAFGILSAIAGPSLTTNSLPRLLPILLRTPKVLLWNWLNLLIFDIANQRLPASVVEDRLNKPWRAVPSGRISEPQARRVLFLVLPLVFAATLCLGSWEEAVLMMVLDWMYNDLGGADEHYVVRNIVNALGFVCYSSGSLRIASGYPDIRLNRLAYRWLAMVFLIVASTLQIQDLPDQAGDRARHRSTAPLVLGHEWARWTVAVPVLAWSLLCPLFWSVNIYAYVLPVVVGGYLAGRVLCLRSVAADETSWKTWCVWTGTLYLLPLAKEYGAFFRP